MSVGLFDRDMCQDFHLSVSTTISLGQNALGLLIAASQFSTSVFLGNNKKREILLAILHKIDNTVRKTRESK